MLASLRRIWRLGLVASVLAVSAAGCRGTPSAAASKPSGLAGQRLFVSWGPLRPSAVAQWRNEGFTTAYKLIGDFAWDKVEPSPGHFDLGAALLQ